MAFIVKNWYYFMKISRIIFKISFYEVARPIEWPNRHILEILLACRHTLVALNRWASVRLHNCLHNLSFSPQLKVHTQILSWPFGHVEKRLDWNKCKGNFKHLWRHNLANKQVEYAYALVIARFRVQSGQYFPSFIFCRLKSKIWEMSKILAILCEIKNVR